MTLIEIKNVDLAIAFCRRVAPKVPGQMCKPNAWWIARANHYAQNAMTATDAAAILASLRPKARAYAITGAKCIRCGCQLTAPESVAAQMGPECMAK